MNQQDKEDFKKMKAGDQSGFESLVLRYKNALIYYIHRYVKNLDTAEELAQDVFVEVWLHPERFRETESFRAWIFGIGHHKAVDVIRKESRISLQETPEDAGQILWEESVEEQFIRKENMSLFYEAFHRLKADYQSALYLADLEGLSYRESALSMEKTEGAFKLLLFRARKALRREMEKGGYRHEI